MIGRLAPFVHGVVTLLLVLLLQIPAWAQEQNKPAQASDEKSAEAQPQKKAEPAAAEPEQKSGTLIVPSEKPMDAPAAETSPNEKPAKKEVAAKQPEGGNYIIKQGDTLWAVSDAFLKDPFLWPFIWKANPYITNADLIYPGNILTIPSLAPIEQAMQAAPEQAPRREIQTAPTGSKPVETAAIQEEPAPAPAPEKLILPEEKPVPIANKYAMLSAGFVVEEQSSDTIVGSLEEKTIFGYDDILYVSIKSRKDAAVGDKFIIYDALNNVKHPITGKPYGRLTKICGVLQLTRKGKGDTFEARIIMSSDSADKHSLLTPYQEPTLVYSVPATKKKDLSGYILEVVDGRTISATIDVVYLDQGAESGVEAGDRFLIYERQKNGKYPRTSIGEVEVIVVKKRTSTAVIRKSTNAVAKGDIIEFKNP